MLFIFGRIKKQKVNEGRKEGLEVYTTGYWPDKTMDTDFKTKYPKKKKGFTEMQMIVNKKFKTPRKK